MKYKIIIGSKKQLTKEQAEKIISFLHREGYKKGEITMINTCDGCGVELPKDYPVENKGNDLCPNCENGKRDGMLGSL